MTLYAVNTPDPDQDQSNDLTASHLSQSRTLLWVITLFQGVVMYATFGIFGILKNGEPISLIVPIVTPAVVIQILTVIVWYVRRNIRKSDSYDEVVSSRSRAA